jgi:Domain of unknown function (DUF4203)
MRRGVESVEKPGGSQLANKRPREMLREPGHWADKVTQMHLPQDVLNLIIGLGIVLGAVQCFFGYRIFKFILGLTGFIVGAALAGAVGYAISHEEAVAFLAGIVGGAIGAALFVALYFVGIFLIGAFLLILAVTAGVIAVIFQKFMIILSTGFGGAWNVVTGIAYFTTGSVDPTNIERLFRSWGSHLYALVLCWLLLGIVGVVVQYKSPPEAEAKAQSPSPHGTALGSPSGGASR